MLKILVSLLLAGSILCVDHNRYKNCSRVEFCANFRYRAPEDKYAVNPETVSVDYEAASVTFDLLANDDSNDLKLTIYSLEYSTFRVKISEVESTRYELQDVLNGDPVSQEFGFVEGNEISTTIVTESGSTVVSVQFSPFTISFYKNDILELVIDGSRLIVESTDSSKAFAFEASFPSAPQLYGIHEHAENIALQSTEEIEPYRLRNVDCGGFEMQSPMSLYGSVPVLYGIGPEVSSGIFLHNAAEQWYEISNNPNGSQAYVMTGTGAFDIFVLLGPTPVDVVRQYVALTGTAHLPQLWALGYHQSRYGYMSQDEVKDVITQFDLNNFQVDTIWLDIDYTDGKRYFTWNPIFFNDPLGLQEFLDSTNRKLITIIDPHIKAEPGYFVYDGALERDLFVKNSDGSNYEADCWPGTSSWMDFLNPAARDYYGSMYHFENFVNSTPTLAGIWNDMNEPSIFNDDQEGLETTFPLDSLHFGGVEDREVHNIYGLLHTKSTHQGLMERDNGEKRPFILSRSHFSGSQRYAAFWTGDNLATWEHLAITYPTCLNANMLGIVFCGADIGGFMGSNPTEELLQRWYQAANWLPFYRSHTDMDRREPYLFPEEIQNVLRRAIQLRYKHLPVWYTLFFEHTRNGDPLIRPLIYQYPSDTNVVNMDNELLVGRDILVRAVVEPEVTSVQVYFPGGTEEIWISITDWAVYNGNEFVDVPVDIQAIPVFYRRGSVVVRKDTVRPSSTEMVNDGHTLYVTLDTDNKAHGTAYIDDNVSFGYASEAKYFYVSIDFNSTNMTVSKIDDFADDGEFEFIVEKIIFNDIQSLPLNGKSGTYRKVIHKFDANGTPLKDIRFKVNKAIRLKPV